MTYFTPDFQQFFKELTVNNHKQWFDENRSRYEKVVKEPFKTFVSDLIAEIQKFDPEILIKPKDAIFRINKDVRFSKDKQPYKTHVAAVISKFSKKEEYPAYFVHLDADKVWLGGGMYSLSPDTLYKVRQEIMYNEKAFREVVNAAPFRQEFGELQGERNKILKPPFKEVAEELPVLYQKQFYFMSEYPSAMMFEADLPKQVASRFEKALPVNQFLRLAVEEVE